MESKIKWLLVFVGVAILFILLVRKHALTYKPTPFPAGSGRKYSCPLNGWVDCMPILSEEGKKACSKEALNWYKANCPNFQGVAQ